MSYPTGTVSPWISVVAENPQVRSAVSTQLTSCGPDRRIAADSQRAGPLLVSQQFHVLVAEIVMLQVNGLDLLIHAEQHANDRNTTFSHMLTISTRIAGGPLAEDVATLKSNKGDVPC